MWFARQYDQLKDARRRWISGEYDRIATGNGSARVRSDPTANEAMRRASFPQEWKIAAIEQAAAAADKALCVYIIRNVTQDARYENMPVPAGRRQFFAARRRFFEGLHVRLCEMGH